MVASVDSPFDAGSPTHWSYRTTIGAASRTMKGGAVPDVLRYNVVELEPWK